MDKAKQRIVERKNRIRRVRKSLQNATRPRLCVRRSLKHIRALVVGLDGKSIAQVSSDGKDFADRYAAADDKTKTGKAKIVGELIAEKAIEQGVQEVVFDRSGYVYHGRVKALADAARGKGLAF
jgi:large subunit ribosomal protein L18